MDGERERARDCNTQLSFVVVVGAPAVMASRKDYVRRAGVTMARQGAKRDDTCNNYIKACVYIRRERELYIHRGHQR